MLIARGNTLATLEKATDEEGDWVEQYLTFPDRSNFFAGGPGHICLFKRKTRSFPAGYTSLIRGFGPKYGFTVDYRDDRVPVTAFFDKDGALSWLQPYQHDAVFSCLERRCGLVKMTTGTGKTEIAAGLLKCVPGKWLFVTNQKDLVANAAQRFAKRISEPIGVIAEGRCSYERITVATFQSIAARILRGDREMLQLLTEVVGIIVDECHSAAAKTINHVLMQCNAYYRIGLSATPLDRTDKRSHYAIGALGPIIHELTAGEAHELGVVALPEIIMLDMEQESGLPTWQGVYGECIVRSGPRNRLLASAVLRAEKPCLLFVKEIRHGRFLEERLLKAKQRVGFVWGNDSMDGRDRAVERLERGDIDTLICSTIFQQGRDIPSLRSVVVGSGGKSLIAALQRIGRGMRTDGGRKASFQVWDIADRGNQWLEHHAKARVKAYRREGYDVRFESTQHGPLFDSFPDRTP